MYRAPTGGAVGGGTALAATGSDVGWWIALGIALLITGLLVLHANRRRRNANQ
ncbi:LPXTG cell wall anchor domain-containing protein [Actinokineospora pegani]|uniref:LPXTG cell wall anchor domain-containing protein n=1 Tax=Actinokineospora pegani TaxID=2654637 RepID=UPI0012EA30FB|nr:LPXTG cell wall anchor domain-containing protein [Actinokineospora pegani]